MRLTDLRLFGFLIMMMGTLSGFPFNNNDNPEDPPVRPDHVERVLVHLRNVEQGDKNLPGSKGVVKLEARRFRRQSLTLDAMATFTNIPVGEAYTVTGMYQGGCIAFNDPLVHWGIWKDLTIDTLRNEFTFVRNLPYIVDVKASYHRDNLANPSLQTGDEVVFDFICRNPSNDPFRAQVVLLLKNYDTGEITRLQQEINLQPMERYVQTSLSYTAQVAGEYHYAAGIYIRHRINAWTDCHDWSEDPMYFVSTEHRTLTFAGYRWDVKAGMGNPGNNLWSNDTSDVWVDDAGRLHLTLSLKENGRWYSSELISRNNFGYGTYTFFINAQPHYFDPNVVGAIFLYKDEQNEIDIELSRWGDSENYQFGSYAVQPAQVPGNQFRFPILSSGSYTTHRIEWTPEQIVFSSWHGHYHEAPPGRFIAHWQYAGNHIPKDEDMKLFFNLWLYRGMAPNTDKKETFTITDFVYEPLVK